jgi:hypothetical protein
MMGIIRIGDYLRYSQSWDGQSISFANEISEVFGGIHKSDSMFMAQKFPYSVRYARFAC